MLFSQCMMDEWKNMEGVREERRKGGRDGGREKEISKERKTYQAMSIYGQSMQHQGQKTWFIPPVTHEIQFCLALSQGSILRILAQSCSHIANVVGEGSAEHHPAVEADAQRFLKGYSQEGLLDPTYQTGNPRESEPHSGDHKLFKLKAIKESLPPWFSYSTLSPRRATAGRSNYKSCHVDVMTKSL